MATLPWKSSTRADPERQYLALLSYLPVKRGWRIPWFLLHTVRVMGQLRKSKGLVGYSLYARLAAKSFWTFSVWEDEGALSRFVHAQPHVGTMAAVAPHMDKPRFVRWTLKGSELPVSWEDVLKR
jgi:quinol monooxygenase YgiN